jgi:hypothetical protein
MLAGAAPLPREARPSKPRLCPLHVGGVSPCLSFFCAPCRPCLLLSAAAFSLAVSAGGAVKAIKMTPLLTIEDGVEATRKGAGYRPPGG